MKNELKNYTAENLAAFIIPVALYFEGYENAAYLVASVLVAGFIFSAVIHYYFHRGEHTWGDRKKPPEV